MILLTANSVVNAYQSEGLSANEMRASNPTEESVATCEIYRLVPDLGEPALESCYSAFRKHCMEIHGLREDNVADSSMHLDLEKWTLTLLK